MDFEKLVRRVVECPPQHSGLARWSRVGNVFALGSTSATQLCERFGCDPETVEFECPTCGAWHAGSKEFQEFCRESCRDFWEQEID